MPSDHHLHTGQHVTREQVLAPVTEDEHQANVIEFARRLGWRIYHTYDSRRSPAGFPDLVLVRPPRLIVVELKTLAGRLSKAQLEWMADLDRCPGIENYVWRPGDPYLEVLR